MRRMPNFTIYSNARRPFSNYQDNQSNIMNRTYYNSNINIFNPNIEFTIRLTTGQSGKLMANPNENLKLAIIKFLKQQNLHDYEIKIKGAVLNGGKLDLNKTLSENNVKKMIIWWL